MVTAAERLTRIETLLDVISTRLDKIDRSVRHAEIEMRADKAELKELKNRGAGLIIGVGLFAGAVGSAIKTILNNLFQ